MSNDKKCKLWKTMRYLVCGLVTILLCSITVAAAKIPRPTSDFFVNDYAGVLDEDVKNHINQRSRQYQSEGGPQVVVVTVESLEGDAIEEYAIRLAREWGIGSKEENNGILILLAVQERNVRIEVGYGLEGVVTDSLSGRFIREATPRLSENDYNSGIKIIYDLVIGELEEPGSYQEGSAGGIGSLTLVIVMVFLLIFGGFIGPRRRFGRYYGSGGFGSGGGGGFRGGGGGFGGGGASGRF